MCLCLCAWRGLIFFNFWNQLADIIVSELLGSFGDNELSPECLYSAQHLVSAICRSQSYDRELQRQRCKKLQRCE
jgi:hypothetical protein